MVDVALPLYPTSAARKALSPTQHAQLLENMAAVLQGALDLPPQRLNVRSAHAFLSSYAKESAHETLESLIWKEKLEKTSSKAIRAIRARALQLAERLANIGTDGAMSLDVLLDVSIAYAERNLSRVRKLWSTALSNHPNLSALISTDLSPSFTTLLDPSKITQLGLYGIRKAIHCISSVIHAVPTDILSSFAHDKMFLTNLAKTYDQGLLSLSQTYGGLQHARGSTSKPDEWEVTWMETKTSMLDVFHLVINRVLEVVGSVSTGPNLNLEFDHAFELFHTLLDIPPTDVNSTTEPIHFYNRSLIADYQHAYRFTTILSGVLRKVDAARMDVLDSQLRSLELNDADGPGALKILIHSDGPIPRKQEQPPITHYNSPTPGPPLRQSSTRDAELESEVSAVLELLPDYAPSYIRGLLTHPDYPFKRSPERVIEALLEGRAPPPEELEMSAPVAVAPEPIKQDEWSYTSQRRNIFDDEQVNLANLRTGKRSESASEILQPDREARERMKADIMRRVEEMDEEERGSEVSDSEFGIKGQDYAFEEELDEEERAVVVIGDGDAESGTDEDPDTDNERTPSKVDPETILELAYIRDPRLFDRDAKTRRDKARTDLKEETGWGDEQIEGWKIMLERMPEVQRQRKLEKHEFRGNQVSVPMENMSRGDNGHRRGGSSMKGQGGRGGRGRGAGGSRGGTNGGSGRDGGDRAWKDKNKAHQANHNRKRGHDKKMKLAGAGT